ncbi:hypothetical protein PGT21_033854 [Puccinia graminis f. sp. tritici]|uniref:Uncharacterized protein n=1 Tax=Puccinia graminis f. sp. tritici TaxID=56615 RepID=A0A5B0M6Q2_PUCGR|nr:hypothetical protein PGT21_033854 [Puccinia graminis f. sp. tritici]
MVPAKPITVGPPLSSVTSGGVVLSLGSEPPTLTPDTVNDPNLSRASSGSPAGCKHLSRTALRASLHQALLDWGNGPICLRGATRPGCPMGAAARTHAHPYIINTAERVL